jgi:hypothetical protein
MSHLMALQRKAVVYTFISALFVLSQQFEACLAV